MLCVVVPLFALHVTKDDSNPRRVGSFKGNRTLTSLLSPPMIASKENEYNKIIMERNGII